MTDYASMRALDVWYDKIDLQRYEDRGADPDVLKEARKRFAERIEAETEKTVPDHLYPKLVTHEGAAPRIKDEPPLIFHPTAKRGPRPRVGLSRRDRRLSRDPGRAHA